MEKVNELCGFIGGIKILEFILASNRLASNRLRSILESLVQNPFQNIHPNRRSPHRRFLQEPFRNCSSATASRTFSTSESVLQIESADSIALSEHAIVRPCYASSDYIETVRAPDALCLPSVEQETSLRNANYAELPIGECDELRGADEI